MYQHGNPGSAEEEVLPQARQTLARAGFAVIGFTDVLNREVSPPGSRSESERAYDQTFQIMWHLLFLQQIPDYFAQTNAEQLAFLRVIDGNCGAAADSTSVFGGGARGRERSSESMLDQPLSYVGVSEGANLAPAFLAFAPGGARRGADRPVVAASPRCWSTSGRARSSPPWPGWVSAQFRPVDVWVMLALFQTIFDGQDAHNFAPYLYRRPFEVAGTTRRASILLTAGLDDSSVPNHVTEALAWASGADPAARAREAARAHPRGSRLARRREHRRRDDGGLQPSSFLRESPMVPPTAGCSSPPLSPQSANEGHYCVQNARRRCCNAWSFSRRR